jgi:hypothetical protein
MASGHVNRTNRPNTWLHRPATRREDSPCQLGAVHTWHVSTVFECPPFGRYWRQTGHRDKAKMERMTLTGPPSILSTLDLTYSKARGPARPPPRSDRNQRFRCSRICRARLPWTDTCLIELLLNIFRTRNCRALYSPPMRAPFSATERFINRTSGTSASVIIANTQKQSK